MFSELWSDLRYRLRAMLRRDDVERELNDELRYHVERETQKYVAQGMPYHEARRRAHVAFGGVERTKDESRDSRGLVLLETARQDLRYAARGLRARPAFTAGVVLTLGLGIGANAAMFGIVDRLLFRTPPYLSNVDRVHRVYLARTLNGVEDIRRNMQFRRFLDLQRETRSFDLFTAFQTRQIAVGSGDASRERNVGVVGSTFFQLFDAPPVLGRYFAADDDQVPSGNQVAVISYPMWQAEFGGRRDVLGTMLQVDRMNCVIIGVAPEGFIGLGDRELAALYVPITAYAYALRGPKYPASYTWSWMELVARRKPGIEVNQATADLTTALQHSWISDESTNSANPVAVARPRAMLGPILFARGPLAARESRVATWISGVAFIVLLIACANVANLLLSRAVARQRDTALRLALGVSRGRLVRQLLTESCVLAFVGGLAGIAFAEWGGATLRAIFLPDAANASVVGDVRTLLFAFAATGAAAILTGLVPALQSTRADLSRTLNSGGRDASGNHSRARTVFLLAQATLSVVLLVGAGLFVRSLLNVQGMRLGYDVEPVVFVQANLRGVKLTPDEARTLDMRLAETARSIPGVVAATPTLTVPFWSNEERGLYVPGIDSVNKLGRFLLQAGSPDYFRVTGTRILRGRAFDEHDGPTSAPVIVVSEGMAKALWPGGDALGKCVRIGSDAAPCSTVIGVAEEMKARSLSDDREYSYYQPFTQYEGAAGSYYVRVNGAANDYTDVIRRRLQQAMPGNAYVTAQPLARLITDSMRSWRFGATMFVAFGGLALVLAAIGLFSVVAYAVTQRRQEIGVRIALGASRANVVRLIVVSGMRIVIAGVMLGGLISLWAGRWVQSLLFQEPPNDPVVYGVVALVLIAVALIATAVPALAAARVDPNVALRAE